MPGPSNTLMIEGSFTELSEELAQYLDSISKTDVDAGIQAEITPLLDTIREDEQSEEPSNPASLQKQKDDVLKKIVSKASILNGAPEKGTSNSFILCCFLTMWDRIHGSLQSNNQPFKPVADTRPAFCATLSISL